MKKLLILMLIVLMCISLPLAQAADNDVSEIKITWLTADRLPESYIKETEWLVFYNHNSEERYILERSTGKMVTEYDYANPFSEELACIRDSTTHKYGFIDTDGNVVIPCEYYYAAPFSDGLSLVSMRDADGRSKGGYIDKSGVVAVPFDYYSSCDYFHAGFASVAKLDANGVEKWGRIDKSGNVVIPFEYEYMINFCEGLSIVSKEDKNGNYKYGYIDTTGAIVVPLMYDHARAFHEGLACVGK